MNLHDKYHPKFTVQARREIAIGVLGFALGVAIGFLLGALALALVG